MTACCILFEVRSVLDAHSSPLAARIQALGGMTMTPAAAGAMLQRESRKSSGERRSFRRTGINAQPRIRRHLAILGSR